MDSQQRDGALVDPFLSDAEYLLDPGQQVSLEISKFANEAISGVTLKLVAPRSCHQGEEVQVGNPVIVKVEESSRDPSISRDGEM